MITLLLLFGFTVANVGVLWSALVAATFALALTTRPTALLLLPEGPCTGECRHSLAYNVTYAGAPSTLRHRSCGRVFDLQDGGEVRPVPIRLFLSTPAALDALAAPPLGDPKFRSIIPR